MCINKQNLKMLGTLTLRSVRFLWLVSATASSWHSADSSLLRCLMVTQLQKISSKGRSCITIKNRKADNSSFPFVAFRSENERQSREKKMEMKEIQRKHMREHTNDIYLTDELCAFIKK